jgi:hypothetical protein
MFNAFFLRALCFGVGACVCVVVRPSPVCPACCLCVCVWIIVKIVAYHFLQFCTAWELTASWTHRRRTHYHTHTRTNSETQSPQKKSVKHLSRCVCVHKFWVIWFLSASIIAILNFNVLVLHVYHFFHMIICCKTSSSAIFYFFLVWCVSLRFFSFQPWYMYFPMQESLYLRKTG